MRSRLAALVVTAGLVLAACGGDNDGSATQTDPRDASLLDFEAAAVDEQVVDVGEYAGTDLVIWFWAPW